MKIWIDITNSPHTNFFDPFINKWKKDGHQIVITCKNLSNTIDLLNLKGWEYAKVDEHAGASIKNKIFFFGKRVLSLRKFLSNEKPDVGIGHASFESPLASRLAGIPFIYLNDNEHAIANYLAFPFASQVFIPDYLRKIAMRKKWNKLFNINFYPGTKEAIYLSKNFEHQSKIKRSYKKLKTIYFRPEPWAAHYYKGQKGFLVDLLRTLSKKFRVIILPRNNDQIEFFKEFENENLKILVKPKSLEEIVADCDLFIGAGGTMNREIAILGIPAISTYQDDLLEVDKFLIQRGILNHNKVLNELYIDEILKLGNPDNGETLLIGNKAFELIDRKLHEISKISNT